MSHHRVGGNAAVEQSSQNEDAKKRKRGASNVLTGDRGLQTAVRS